MFEMEPQVLEKLNSFFSQYKPLTIKKGKILYQPDDQILNIYLLKEGLVRQYSISEKGDEVTINVFRPYSFFPIMLILANQSNNYFFEAQTDITAFRAPAEKVIEFLKSEPEVLFDLTKRFSAAITGLSKRIEELSFDQASNRIASLLLYLAQRFGEQNDGEIIINLPLTHQDLASWTSLTRETASRQLKNLSSLGIISYNRQSITILDKNRLLKS